MKKLAAALLILVSGYALSGVTCGESVTSVILHKNKNIYFTTDKACTNWCQIKWIDEGDKNRAFSALLAAKTAKNKISFRRPIIDACTEKNATYNSPDYFAY